MPWSDGDLLNLANMQNKTNLVYNALDEDYGVTGDGVTNDAAAIQTAVTDASTDGRALFFPDGTYRVTSTVTIPTTGIKLLFAPNAVVDLSGLASTTPAFTAAGSDGTAIALTANADEGDTSVSVGSTTGFAAGGWARVGSTAVSGSTSVPKGEIVRVASVAASSITLEDPLCDDYATADTADITPVTMVSYVQIEGGHWKGGTDTDVDYQGLELDRCLNVVVKDCRFTNCYYAGVRLIDCVGFSIENINSIDAGDAANGLGYGVKIDNGCQNGSVVGCTGVGDFHLVNIGGSTGRNGVSRRIQVVGCTESQAIDAGFDCHPGHEDITFSACSVLGSANDGIISQAASGSIVGCTVRNVTRHGIFVQALSNRSRNFVVTGNRVRRAGSRGIYVGVDSSYQGYEGITITGNTVEISTQPGISCENSDSGTYFVMGLVVSNNMVEHDSGAAGHEAIYLRGCRESVVSGNRCKLGTGVRRGVYLLDSDNCTVVGNVTSEPGAGGNGLGIELDNCDDCVVTGNRTRLHSVGIRLQNTVTATVVVGNSARDCTAPINPGTGTTNLLADNMVASGAVQTLADDATPSIRGGHIFKTGGTTSITDFDNGVVGQELLILAAHNVTITDGAPIILSGGANYSMTPSDTLVLRMIDDQVWQEVSRSVN